MARQPRISVTVSLEVHDSLQEYADSANRTLSNYCSLVLAEHCKTMSLRDVDVDTVELVHSVVDN